MIVNRSIEETVMKMRMASAFAIFLLFIAAPASAGMSDAELKSQMIDSYFYAGEEETRQAFNLFKEQSAVTDEQLHRVLMDIYHEAEDKLQTLTPGTEEWNYSRGLVDSVIRWLPRCKGIPIKDFLLANAASEERHCNIRHAAILSYLRVADAEEARNILLRFLVGEDRMDSQARSSILEHAHTAYREAELGKKRAIIESLYASLASEDAKWLFRVYDRILTRLSPQYASSEQRRDILRRLIQAKPTCKADEYAMEGLQNMLRSLEETTPHTSINTNLAVLRERDFSQPSSADENIALEIPPDTPAVVGTVQEKPSRGAHKGIYAVAAVAGLLAAFGLWLSLRGKRGSA
jgi:flagellin-specific chaperone FliS